MSQWEVVRFPRSDCDRERNQFRAERIRFLRTISVDQCLGIKRYYADFSCCLHNLLELINCVDRSIRNLRLYGCRFSLRWCCCRLRQRMEFELHIQFAQATVIRLAQFHHLELETKA